ncbi:MULTISPECIES: S41 family peptidase [unclassified Mucilaginibacter]|uniref:S41 family peptidase n=1 Tax=unclassified Mucilaginibacter TaxID=2617802 RepID=UPI002AC9CA1D|nr:MULTISPECIES: S41 family peptidase [unclassified Mucilaginibacter]MEB0248582.1 S41 family peptidase [Mucilaginibacter sp. 5B2]MEB0262769.1 S41 family peptidase [Mucilaginibacter sp. 10I4]MEB0280195.1 S41 family peptidase [Mucilaginibacter sp. 10B2]MEB0302932.1 S41 family peptidase [Mucilaginibacter sp. 5C4]WPX24396.1 S41 family peptidase [Mucilaginibacter sp. 5C4]
MKRTAGIIFRTLILILIGIGIGILLTNGDMVGRKLGLSAGPDKISRVLSLVNNKYVDSVNTDSIEGVTVNDMLQNLDPHSVYLPAQQARSINERLEGGFNGIGLEYQLLRDTLVITQVNTDGPAAKAGVMVGDRVINVDGKPFSGTKLDIQHISKTFRGEKDTQISLGISRDGFKKIKDFPIKRDRVSLSSLDAAYNVGSAGYVKISKFASTTDSDFRGALKKLKANGMQKLVLDLRGNGGGYLNTATSMADEFLSKGKLIVYTKGSHEPRTDYFATDSGSYENGDLTVIIDEYSASASEILAGALQDLDRATIVGRRSFGKGLVQQQFPFGDGTAINLTVARYYTPSGRSIQKSYANGLASYRNELLNRIRKGELLNAGNNLSDSAFFGGSTYHTTKGRKVFSRGGIMPDVFVPADTAQNTQLVGQLAQNQLFTAYIIDRLQPALSKYPTADNFIEQYNLSDEGLKNFIAYALQTIKQINPAELQQSKETIKILVKANAARFKWGNNAYYRVLNANDTTFKKALASD